MWRLSGGTGSAGAWGLRKVWVEACPPLWNPEGKVPPPPNRFLAVHVLFGGEEGKVLSLLDALCESVIIFETSYHDSLFVGGSPHGTGVSLKLSYLLLHPCILSKDLVCSRQSANTC